MSSWNLFFHYPFSLLLILFHSQQLLTFWWHYCLACSEMIFKNGTMNQKIYKTFFLYLSVKLDISSCFISYFISLIWGEQWCRKWNQWAEFKPHPSMLHSLLSEMLLGKAITYPSSYVKYHCRLSDNQFKSRKTASFKLWRWLWVTTSLSFLRLHGISQIIKNSNLQRVEIAYILKGHGVENKTKKNH